MPPAPFPHNEHDRLRALAGHPSLNGRRDDWSDRLALVAATLARTPIALVSIVARDTQWFKGCSGIDVDGTPRDQSICGHAILQDQPLVVEDATKDPRFADNPLVTGTPGIRFYAGVPLLDEHGFALGTLCVIHTQPHALSAAELESLKVLASMVRDHLLLSRVALEAAARSSVSEAEAQELADAKKALEYELRRRDELERRLAEQARARQIAEQRSADQQRALDTAGIVAITDRAGKILHVNDNFCAISGYSRHELLGANHRLLNSGHHPKDFFRQMYATIGRGGTWRAEICNRAKNGSLYWVDTTIVPLRDEHGRVAQYIALRIDVTARKQAEVELESAKLAAEAASRAKSEFLANMSHEIRTPLTAVLGYADMLRDDDAGRGSGRRRTEIIDTICNAGHHLLTVINDILDLSKIEAGKMSVERLATSLPGVICEVASLVRPRLAAKGVELIKRLDTPVPESILCDATRLRQILLNLAGNAAKFTHAGSVVIAARVEQGAGAPMLVIDVEDSGVGLNAEQASRLFKPFSQADSTVTREHGGTGLGLTISQRLSNLMGGTVTLARTEPGKGSCFRLAIPMVAAPGTALTQNLSIVSGAIAAPIGQEARVLGRVLLAEDGADNRRLITHHLVRAGARVEVAENGAVALAMLRDAGTAGKPYDLLLTDMQMPIIDGYTLAAELRAQGSTMPIIALTAHAMAEDRERCLAAGCDDYATKPIDRAALIATCARWIGKASVAHARRAAA